MFFVERNPASGENFLNVSYKKIQGRKARCMRNLFLDPPLYCSSVTSIQFLFIFKHSYFHIFFKERGVKPSKPAPFAHGILININERRNLRYVEALAALSSLFFNFSYIEMLKYCLIYTEPKLELKILPFQ